MANFTGFNTRERQIVQSDVHASSQSTMRCYNSLLFNLNNNIVVAELLEEAFSIFRGDPQRQQKTDQVKDTFIWVRNRLQLPTLNFIRSAGTTPTNLMGHAAEVRTNPFVPDTIFVKDVYFSNQPLVRVTTIIHECIHLRFPNNPGDGHPGGIFVRFARGALNLQFNDALRNPFSYQYFAQFLP